MNSDIEKRVLQFFQNNLHKKVNIDTVINRIFSWEDDVYDEFVLFFEKFEINPKDFNILKYFYPNPESIFIFKLWYGLIIGKFKSKNLPPLTVAHMIEVAKRKEWFDPE